jgi:hypothetical protein
MNLGLGKGDKGDKGDKEDKGDKGAEERRREGEGESGRVGEWESGRVTPSAPLSRPLTTVRAKLWSEYLCLRLNIFVQMLSP